MEGADSGALLWLSAAESGTLASLLGSALEGAADRGVGAGFWRTSVAFRAVGFSGDVSSMVTLHIDRAASRKKVRLTASTWFSELRYLDAQLRDLPSCYFAASLHCLSALEKILKLFPHSLPLEPITGLFRT